MSRIIFFIFAGRKVNMEIQKPYLDRLLTQYPEAELHLWDLTRAAADSEYLRSLEGAHDGRVQVLRHLHSGHPIPCRHPGQAKRRRGHPPCLCIIHKPPYEKPYAYYAGLVPEADDPSGDPIYVKLDDDVLFLETECFGYLIAPLAEHPERVISANVINNAVCAKYANGWEATANEFEVGDPRKPANDTRWWALHTLAEFARWSHRRFLRNVVGTLSNSEPAHYIRTRPGEAISINCIAFTHQTMIRLAGMMNDRLGDEGAVDRLLPWIAMNFHAAHLTFGPQDQTMDSADLASLRSDYTQLAKEYLA